MLKHNVPLCSCGFFFLLENGIWSIPSNTTSPCHLPNSDCTLHVKTLAVWRGVFGWSPELWEVTLWLSVYVQNVNNLRAEQLSACTRFLFFFCFPSRSETRQVRGLRGVRGAGDSGWKGGFQLDTFHGCFGKQWWKQGRSGSPFLPLGSLRCQSKKQKKESLQQYRMSSASSDFNPSGNKFSHTSSPAGRLETIDWGQCSHETSQGR